jgi:hypothetical protein
MAVKKKVGYREIEDRVTEELQPLIVILRATSVN